MKIPRLFAAASALLMLTFNLIPDLRADVTVPAGKSVEERLDELEQEIRILKRVRELELDEKKKEKEQTPVVSAGDKGFGFKSQDGNFEIRFKGYVQTDTRYFIGDSENPGVDQFLLRRVRPILEGKLSKYAGFRIMPDYSNGTFTLQDAWVDFYLANEFNIRAGKFKSPMSLERGAQSITNSAFTELGLTSNLVPNRDIGVDFYGTFLDSRISYDLAAVDGAPDLGSIDGDTRDDKELVARIFTQPFKGGNIESLDGFGVGIGTSWGKSQGNASASNLGSYKTPGQQTFFSYVSGTYAEGDRLRIIPQAYYYKGPLGLLTEFVVSRQDVTRTVRKENLINKAWQVVGSWVLTGENASFTGVKPNHPFDLGQRTWGALEFVARVHGLELDKDAFPFFANPTASAKSATAWGIGLNWYLSKNLKYMLDFDETFFDGGLTGGRDRETENFLSSRLQAAF